MEPPSATSSGPARLVAWSGTAVFFAALAYFLYGYTVTFAYAIPGPPGIRAISWDVTLFTLFALHHSVFARAAIRDRVMRVVSSGLERSVYVWVASLLFIAVCALWQPVGGVAWTVGGAARWMLWVVQAIGIWLTLHSAAVIDIRELAGLRQIEDAPHQARPTGTQEFKTSGPYGWVRHPIYTGWFLIVFATSPMTMTRLVFAVVSSAYLLVAIPLEERSLRASSGGAYGEYMRQVRWKLLPGILGWSLLAGGWW